MNYAGKKVLVTGADGFIGSHLVERLVAAGADVTALSLYNAFGRYGWLDDLAAETLGAVRLATGDVRDAAFVSRLVAGHDLVFHLAALIAIPHSYAAAQSYVDVNVTGTLNVLEAARSHGVARVVHTSTSEVYGTARFTPIPEDHPLQGQSPYSASKIGADMMAHAYACSFDLPVVILRPFNTFGPRQSERAVIASTIRQALDPNRSVIKVGDLGPRRDFSFVEDITRAFALVGGAESLEYGLPYNAGTGAAVTIGEVVDMVRALTGTDKPVEREEVRLRPDNSEVRALVADGARLKAACGWLPEVPLEEGLKRTIAWWREQLAAGRVRRSAEFAP